MAESMWDYLNHSATTQIELMSETAETPVDAQ